MVWCFGLQYSIVVFLNHAHILFPWVPHASLLNDLQVLQLSCRKRDSKLLYFNCPCCHVDVSFLCHFHDMPRVGLFSVNRAFTRHTHLPDVLHLHVVLKKISV